MQKNLTKKRFKLHSYYKKPPEIIQISTSAWLPLFTLGTTSILANLLWITAVWGQSAFSSASTRQTSLISTQIQPDLVPQLDQLESASTNAADLLSTCDNNLLKTEEISLQSHCQAQTKQLAQVVEPTEDRLRIGINNEDPRAFTFGIGSQIGEPTALKGPTRLGAVETIGQKDLVFPIAGYLQQGLGPNQRLLLEILGDVQGFGLDLSYSIVPETIPGSFSINVQTVRSLVGVFEGGNPDVNLPGNADPWVHSNGGGVEYYFPFSSQFSLASAFNYRVVSVRPGAFTDKVTSVDEQGNKVTVSDDGLDPLLTFNIFSIWTNVDDVSFPTKGSRVRFGIDTSIPVGDASISFGRFSGKFNQFIPLNLFGFTKGPRTLIFDIQAGTMVGDVPPYSAYTMGGAFTVRGYKNGELGSGSSFLVAAAEYRFPIANDLHLLTDFDLQGGLFFDYGTDFNTADQVIGIPGIVRNKAGNGFGYGLAINLKLDFGLVRSEFAFNDDGGFVGSFTVGDRY